jgi:spore coat protein U-like protein
MRSGSYVARIALVAAGLIGAAGLATLPASAATQGSKGQNSSGTVGVSATIEQLVQISDLDDFSFGTVDGTQEVTQTDGVCVWSNTGGYEVSASSSSGGGTNFQMDGPDNATLNYNVAWNHSNGANNGTSLDSAQQISGKPFNGGPNCGGNTNATLLVTLPTQSDVTAGSYSDTLTISVSPQ